MEYFWEQKFKLKITEILSDKTIDKKLCTLYIPIMIKKITSSENLNYWLTRLYTQLFKTTNQNLIMLSKFLKPTNKSGDYKTIVF